MADVQISNTPPAGEPRSGGGGAWAWVLLVIVLLAVIAWLVFGGGLSRTTRHDVDVNISAPSGGSGGGTSGGTSGGATSGGTSGGATKTP